MQDAISNSNIVAGLLRVVEAQAVETQHFLDRRLAESKIGGVNRDVVPDIYQQVASETVRQCFEGINQAYPITNADKRIEDLWLEPENLKDFVNTENALFMQLTNDIEQKSQQQKTGGIFAGIAEFFSSLFG